MNRVTSYGQNAGLEPVLADGFGDLHNCSGTWYCDADWFRSLRVGFVPPPNVNANTIWQSPAEANGFVAAMYLKQEPAGAEPPTTPPTEIAATTNAVADVQPIAAPPTEPPTVPAASTNAPPATDTNAVASTTTEPPAAEEKPPEPRIVQREGLVRGTVSIQAPTRFALISPENARTIDYLHTTSPNLDLARYKGLHIIVTGEEGLDERWGNTPVINIQKIQVLE